MPHTDYHAFDIDLIAIIVHHMKKGNLTAGLDAGPDIA